MKELCISRENAGGRLDKTVLKYLNQASSGFVYKMLRKKNIVLNDKKASGPEILKEGDIIKLYLADDTLKKFRKEKEESHSSALKPLILYEDECLLAVCKPIGMLSQKSQPADSSLNDLVAEYLNGEDPLFTPGISNRLDRNTGGIVLAGKSPAAVRELNRALRTRALSKYYYCLVKGVVRNSGFEEAFLVKDPAKNQVCILSKNEAEKWPDPRAVSYISTAYEPVGSNGEYTLLKIDLITGRSHQIRAHMAAIGHPLVGDEKYGDRKVNEKFRKDYRLNGQFLYAFQVEFHDMEGILAYLNGNVLTAPLPADFIKIIEGEKLWLPGKAEA